MTEPVVVSWSEISSARQCPHKHRLEYRDRWRRDTKSQALKTGLLWHAALEWHYIGQNPGDLFVSQEDQTTADLVRWMWDGYQAKWFDTNGEDLEWEVVSAEQPFEIELGYGYRFKGRLDLLVRDERDRVWIVDHKSGGQMPNATDLAFDDQFGLYMWALRSLGVDVFGMCWNAALTRRNKVKAQDLDDRFRRLKLHRTDEELSLVAADALDTVRYMYEHHPDQRHPNTQTCKYRCDYSEACLIGRKSGGVAEIEALEAYGFAQNWERH